MIMSPTSINGMQGGQFDQLPSELQLMILGYVYKLDGSYLTYLGDYHPDPEPLKSLREQLKPVRLISRAFHDAVTPVVFSSIHLHASQLSLRRAENIANSHLASHVREIVHHEGTFGGDRDDEQHFFSMLRSHRRRRDYPKDFQTLADEQLYQNYLLEVAGGRAFKEFDTERMTALLGKLPKCITFTTLPYSTQWCDPMTSAYTLSRTGLSYLPIATKLGSLEDPSFVISMTKWRPQAHNLANFSYDPLYRLLQQLPQTADNETESTDRSNWAEDLAHLRIGWPTGSQFPGGLQVSTLDYVRSLTCLFQNTHNLRHLELTHGFEVHIPTPIFPEDGLPKLSRLTVSRGNMDGQWSERFLHACIKALAPTLRHLHFENVSLQRFVEGPHFTGKNDGSLLRLLFNITPFTNLQSCTGLDTVVDIKCNGRMKQAFSAPGYKPGKSSILPKVQNAVCGHAWPDTFDMTELPMDINPMATMMFELTSQGAFMFSSWEYTVDPWDVYKDYSLPIRPGEPTNAVVDDAAQPSIVEHEESALTVQDQPGPSVTTATENSNSRPKRSRISRLLGLK